MLKTPPNIPDVKDFRCVSKRERIFLEAMGKKEFQVQEESWILLGLQGWLREIQKKKKKYVCEADANGSLKEEEQAGDSVQR